MARELKKYLITSELDSLEKKIEKHKPDYILYRDKTTDKYAKKAEKFLALSSIYGSTRFFLHRDYELASALNAHGVHLTSEAFENIAKAKKLGLKVIVSTHTLQEVQEVERLGADYVTYSPIFETPDKGEPKGIEDLENLLDQCGIKVFALGGIVTSEHVKEISKTKSYGFASIRYFN